MRRRRGELPDPRPLRERIEKRSRFVAQLRQTLLTDGPSQPEGGSAATATTGMHSQENAHSMDGRDEPHETDTAIEIASRNDRATGSRRDNDGCETEPRGRSSGNSESRVSTDETGRDVNVLGPESRVHSSKAAHGLETQDNSISTVEHSTESQDCSMNAQQSMQIAALNAAAENMSTEELERMKALFSEALRRRAVSLRTSVGHCLTLEFLRRAKAEKEHDLEYIRRQVAQLDRDISAIGESVTSTSPSADSEQTNYLRFRKTRMNLHFADLRDVYFSQRQEIAPGRSRVSAGANLPYSLEQLATDINMITQYHHFRYRATLLHGSYFENAPATDGFRPSNFVSSMAFQRGSKYLATAGVARRIKIFDCTCIERDYNDDHFPVSEIATEEKLSCITWNPYFRSHLASSDYEGVVHVRDVNRGSIVEEFDEHERRAWSVAYCSTNPNLLASGAEDGKIKIWSMGMSESAMSITNRTGQADGEDTDSTSHHASGQGAPVNFVCAVAFNPTQGHMIAVGAGPHHVLCYDLRNARQPLHVFQDHNATVSYVRFMSESELVSGCPDSTVRLWDVSRMEHVRTFSSHLNQRRFVGLSVTSDYIAVGSETGDVYAYYKNSRQPIARYHFAAVDAFTGREIAESAAQLPPAPESSEDVETAAAAADSSTGIGEEDDSRFISSVCWSPDNSALVAVANGRGSVRLVEIAGD